MTIHSKILERASAACVIKHIRPGWTLANLEPYPHGAGSPHKLISGDEFNFKIVRRMPAGAAADVYIAKDIEKGSEPLIKSAQGDKFIIKRYKRYVPLRAIEREYNILRHLNCIQSLQRCIPTDPVLIQTFDTRYLIYPYIPGTDASEHQKHILKEQSLECLKQYIYNILRLANVCQTYANITHLDIKPNNMIYCPIKKKLSLIDFGTARYFSPTNRRKLMPISQPIGTEYYAAPEISDLNFNNTSDTYCIGRIIQYFWSDIVFCTDRVTNRY